MRGSALISGILVLHILGLSHAAYGQNTAKPVMVLQKVVSGMPIDKQQEVRVLTATIKPGEKSVRHTHQYPVTVYVLQGEFTLVVKGQTPIVAKAGDAIVEQPGVEVYAANASATEDTKVVIFYASKPQTPFLDPLKD